MNEPNKHKKNIQHLKHWGIDMAAMSKTEKSIAELEVDQNLKFEFRFIQESGKQLEPVHGPGLTGLENLGNSCYLSSVMQVLFSLPPFQQRYYDLAPKILQGYRLFFLLNKKKINMFFHHILQGNCSCL